MTVRFSVSGDCSLAIQSGARIKESDRVSCESFRNFVMCLHGLDILSIWVLFFSLLCTTASAFQYSHLAKDLEVFVTNCMDNPRSCSAGVDEMRVFEIVCILMCRPCFLVSLVPLSRIQQLCLFPFLVCTQTYLEVCVVERIVARSVSSPELFLLSASVCVAPFFSNTLFARVGNYLFFRVHGSTRFVSSSLSYVAVSRSREEQLG